MLSCDWGFPLNFTTWRSPHFHLRHGTTGCLLHNPKLKIEGYVITRTLPSPQPNNLTTLARIDDFHTRLGFSTSHGSFANNIVTMYRSAYDPELKGRVHVDGTIDKVCLYRFPHLHCKVTVLITTITQSSLCMVVASIVIHVITYWFLPLVDHSL